MLQIKYTNGDVQNINVAAEFYTPTVEEKKGKRNIVTPIDKAFAMGLDLAVSRGTELHAVSLSKDGDVPRERISKPMPDLEKYHIPPTEEFLKEKRILRNETKHQPFTQKWNWTF